MEQVLERKIDWRNIRVYDDDGSEIRNPDMLKAIANAQEYIAMWEKSVED